MAVLPDYIYRQMYVISVIIRNNEMVSTCGIHESLQNLHVHRTNTCVLPSLTVT